MGLMWICLWDLTVSLRKFTEAKWENVRNIHNTQGGFLITNIIVQIAYESSLLYVLEHTRNQEGWDNQYRVKIFQTCTGGPKNYLID